MQNNRSVAQHMGALMTKQSLDMNRVFELVELLNTSCYGCRDAITIFEDVFKHEKSDKIQLATLLLEYLIKNCNRNFHMSANRESFQKSVLGLFKRQRGKTNFLKEMRSNSGNWNKIEVKMAYLVQLWYDAFILEEGTFPHIINNYKILRKENIIFPPRDPNEKNLMVVATESPIFDEIETIARNDLEKFNKKIKSTVSPQLRGKMDEKLQNLDKKISKQRKVDIDDISEKIAIIRSQEYEGNHVLKIIAEIKKDIEFGTVQKNQEAYWKEIKLAASQLIVEWEERNAELIRDQEKQYMEQKLIAMNGKKIEQQSPQEVEAEKKVEQEQKVEPQQEVNLLDL